MSIVIDSKYGGSESTFFSTILAIQELSKVDPSVSLFCHIQNVVLTQIFQRHASKEQLDKYLPRMAKDTVGHQS